MSRSIALVPMVLMLVCSIAGFHSLVRIDDSGVSGFQAWIGSPIIPLGLLGIIVHGELRGLDPITALARVVAKYRRNSSAWLTVVLVVFFAFGASIAAVGIAGSGGHYAALNGQYYEIVDGVKHAIAHHVYSRAQIAPVRLFSGIETAFYTVIVVLFIGAFGSPFTKKPRNHTASPTPGPPKPGHTPQA